MIRLVRALPGGAGAPIIAHCMSAPRPHLPFFSSALSWNFALGMTQLLIPLYARELGFSGIAIGALVALPIVFQIAFNLIGGAWTDRLGGMTIARGAFVATVAAGAMFAVSSSFAGLLAAQMAMIVARATYWPASWSVASTLPGDHSRVMGSLNAVSGLGQIAGTVAAGMVIAWWGFGAGFWTVSVMGAASFALALSFRSEPPKTKGGPPPMLATYAMLLRRRTVYYGIMCAFMSALPFSLSVSFYPILLVEQGFDSEAAGWLVGLRAGGSIAAGAVLARFVRRADDPTVPLVSALIVAASVGLVALFRDAVVIGVFMLGVGLGSGIMTIYFQVLVSAFSSPEYRGSAMALAGMGWSVSHLSTPILMGWLADAYGIHIAFYVLGALAFAVSLALLPMYRWARGEGAFR
jgi:MFS family permease